MRNCTLKGFSSFVWVAAASLGLFAASCQPDKPEEPGQPANTTPVITAFSPTSGPEGASVEITGDHFSDDKSKVTVKFNGLNADVVSSSTTKITTKVPVDATSGKITVTVKTPTGDKTTTSATDFTVNPLAPAITAITPDKGDVGAAVKITGTNFKAGSTSVFFGSVQATDVTVTSRTEINTKVPANAATAKVKVIVNGAGEAISPVDFYVKPTISSFTPASAFAGEEVTITGTSFSTITGETTVKFGTITVAAADVTVVSATQLKAKVPSGLSTSTPVKITVEVKGQAGVSTADFTLMPPPSVSNVTPMHGEENSVVTITGTALSSVTEVFIGGLEATIKSKTSTQIEFYVPTGFNGATNNTGAIKINAGNNQQTLPGTFEITNVWKKMSSYASGTIENRYGYMASFSYGDRIYWGLGLTSEYRNDILSYNMATPGNPVIEQTNEPTSTLKPAPRSTMSSTVLGDKAYIMGGDGTTTYNDIWEYDITQNKYTKKATVLPGGVFYTSFVVGGKLYVHARYNNPFAQSYIYEYDPVADQLAATPFKTWSTGPGYFSWAEIEVIGNIVYFIGNKTVVALDMTTQGFTTYSLPTSVQGIGQKNFICYTDGTKIYLGGGICSSCTSNTANDFYEFNPATGVTTRLADVPQLQFYRNPVGVKNGRGYVLADDGMYQYIPNY